MVTLLALLFFMEILKKALKKSSENDLSTGHFQSFFFRPLGPNSKFFPVNQISIKILTLTGYCDMSVKGKQRKASTHQQHNIHCKNTWNATPKEATADLPSLLA